MPARSSPEYMRAYRAKHRVKIAAQQKAYREANKEHTAAVQRAYGLANPRPYDAVKAKAYRQKNADRIREQAAAHHARHPDARKGYMATQASKVKALTNAARDQPCVDCGIRLPPPCMDFDHVRGEKTFTISNWHIATCAEGMTKLETIQAEIDKCDVRCPTCHRLRHYEIRSSS